MAWIRRVRTEQPPPGTGIDWGNPLAIGLRLVHTGAAGFNPGPGFASGHPVRTSALTDNATKYGPGWVCDGTSRYVEIPIDGIAPPTPFTLACLAAPASTIEQVVVCVTSKSGNNRCQIESNANVWAAYTNSGNFSANAGSSVVGRYDFVAADFGMGAAGASKVWVNGIPGTGTAVSAGASTYTTAAIGARYNSGYGLFGNNRTSLVLAWGRLLKSDEHVSLAANPWQLFEPEQIWVPASAGAGNAVTPDVGSISIIGYAPTITQPRAVAPAVESITITGYAPTIAQPKNVTPAVGSIAITGYAPSVARTENQAVVPGVGSITITGYAPTVVQASPSQNITPDVGSIAITGYAPTVTQTRATQSEGGGWMPPRGRRKTRKEVYAERVKLGILPPAIVRAAEKVAVVAETVAEFKADRPRYEEMFMRELNVTKWAPSYTRAIQAQIEILEQEDEDILLLM